MNSHESTEFGLTPGAHYGDESYGPRRYLVEIRHLHYVITEIRCFHHGDKVLKLWS